MKSALEVASTESPLLATVECVLPGVQQRFNDVSHQIRGLEQRMPQTPWVTGKFRSFDLFLCLLLVWFLTIVCPFAASEMQVMLDSSLEAHSARYERWNKDALALELARMAIQVMNSRGALGGGRQGRDEVAEPSPRRSPSPSPPSEPAPDLSRYKHAVIQQRNNPTSVTAIYEEYHGEGDYKGQPMDGGFKALEETF
jgi:hypothetical protein